MAVTHSDDIEPGQPFDAFGVRVQASNTVVADAYVHSLTGETQDWGVAGIKLQAGLDGVMVTGNTVTDLHSAG